MLSPIMKQRWLLCLFLTLLSRGCFAFHNSIPASKISSQIRALQKQRSGVCKLTKRRDRIGRNFDAETHQASALTILQNVHTKRKILRKLIVSLAAGLTTMLWNSSSALAASTTISKSGPALLGSRNVLSATALLISLACLPMTLSGMSPLANALVVSASRCAVQVSLLGSVVLQKIMGVTHSLYVVAWVFGVGILAGRESIARIQYTYPKMERNMYLSILTGGLTVLGLTMGLKLLGNVQPWFDPRVWIPIAGMLFGNTLNASALGAATITKQFATQSNAVELRLARGATMKQAVRPLMEESYRTALTPTINGLAATGIIHIPGMMSGQILAGQSPQQAALYQIMINFLIATVATFTCQLVIKSTVQSLVDNQQTRLKSSILEPRTKSEASSWSWKSVRSIFSSEPAGKEGQGESVAENKPIPAPCVKLISGQSKTVKNAKGSRKTNEPVLELRNVRVAKAGIEIDDLTLRRGDRLAITGKSGIGKSQLLRTIVGLEQSEERLARMLHGAMIPARNMVNFRKRVALVPQTNSMLEETPRKVLEEFGQYHAGTHDYTSREHRLVEITKAWELEESVLDKPFSTLSGGQAQRASVAIALSFEPEALLMDESTNALDEATSRVVEQTLIDCGIPIVVVTHSREQLTRFCTHEIRLE